MKVEALRFNRHFDIEHFQKYFRTKDKVPPPNIIHSVEVYVQRKGQIYLT